MESVGNIHTVELARGNQEAAARRMDRSNACRWSGHCPRWRNQVPGVVVTILCTNTNWCQRCWSTQRVALEAMGRAAQSAPAIVFHDSFATAPFRDDLISSTSSHRRRHRIPTITDATNSKPTTSNEHCPSHHAIISAHPYSSPNARSWQPRMTRTQAYSPLRLPPSAPRSTCDPRMPPYP